MSNIAFVFPGQGSQFPTMAKDFYTQFEVSRRVFDLAEEVTGIDMPRLCFEENTKLNMTEYTQIAMLTAEAAILSAVKEQGISSQVNAGLSLGEYAALIASGGLSEKDAFSIIRKRGIYMEQAYPTGGAMAAVFGISAEIIKKICEETQGDVFVANYNCPGQTVITGQEQAVYLAGEKLKKAGARRVVPLRVSGPFHCCLMNKAGIQLEDALENIEIHSLKIPYVSNVTGGYVRKSSEVKKLLVKQVSSSVRWQQCVEEMIRNGVDTFIEIGPGKTLTGFIKKIDKNCRAFHVEKIEDLDVVRKECYKC